jgi:UDP-glucose 4-epimerase
MTIVVTGSESFVGQELIKQCMKQKIPIIGFDTVNAKNTDYSFHQIDIRSPKIQDVIPNNTESLVHLAALSRDPDCKGKGYECFDVNVMGTLNLIKASLEKNVKQFIFASSEWVYDEFKQNEEKDENDFINISNHTSEYALSKLVSETNLKQQYLNGFSPVTILRFGIIYGPRKNNWSAVESIISTIKNESELTVGSLKNGRRFIHVSDIARGIIKSIGLKGFNIINLTGNKVITLGDIIEYSQRILMKTVTVHEKNPTQINVRNPSNVYAKKILNWEPEVDLDDGLKTILPFI